MQYIRKKDIPWFSLSAYDKATEMNITHWHNALMIRAMMEQYLPLKDAFVEKVAKHLMQEPILMEQRGPIFLTGRIPPINDLKIDDAYFFRDLFNRQGMEIALNECVSHDQAMSIADDDLRVAMEKKIDWDLIESGFIDYCHQHSALYSNTEQVICVNMNVTDDELIKEFKQWLRNKRGYVTSAIPKRKIDQDDIDKWINLKILPFLDIELICRFNNRPITNATLGELLFPDEEVDVAEKIRKTVRPLAKIVSSFAFLEAMRNQIGYKPEDY